MGPFSRRRSLSLVLGLLTLSVPAAFCQTDSDQDLMSLSIEDLSKVKVYGASRRLEEVRQTPASVSIITADEIRHYGWRTLADVLSSLRGFYASYDRNYSYLGVRGFLRPGDFNSRVLFLLNGHRLNDNVYGSAAIGTEFPLDLDLIDHIEVVRGPGSSLFGTNAVFGTLNIVTRRPSSQPTLEISGDSSSFLGRTGRITGSATRGRLSALLSGTMYQSAGASRLFFPEFASPDTNGGFAESVDGDRYSQMFSDVEYGDFRFQGLYSSRMKIVPTGSYGTNFDDPGTRTTDANGFFDVAYHHVLTSQTEYELRTYYDHYSYYGTYAYGGTNSSDRYLNYDSSVADWSGVEALVNHKFGPHNLTFGANYEYSFRVNQETHDEGQPSLLNDHRTPWLAAAFAETEFKLRHDLAVRGGMRFDYFQDSGSAISPRAALVYTPNPRTALKYIYGRAFRAPNAYESYYTDGIVVEPPARPLQKENIQSNEIVFDRSLTAWLGVTIDGYYNALDHLIDWVPDLSNGMIQPANIGEVRGRGLELEFDAKRPSGWEGRVSYGLADALDQVNRQRPDNSPLHLAKLNGTIPVTRHAFAGLEMQYIGAQQSYQETRVSPAFLTNLTLSTKPFWGGWEVSGSCYNLMDRRWFNPAGPAETQAAIQQDGRTFRFKLSYRLSRGEKRGRP